MKYRAFFQIKPEKVFIIADLVGRKLREFKSVINSNVHVSL